MSNYPPGSETDPQAPWLTKNPEPRALLFEDLWIGEFGDCSECGKHSVVATHSDDVALRCEACYNKSPHEVYDDEV